jgi:hypothetical protein
MNKKISMEDEVGSKWCRKAEKLPQILMKNLHKNYDEKCEINFY